MPWLPPIGNPLQRRDVDCVAVDMSGDDARPRVESMPAEQARNRDLVERDRQVPDEDDHPDVDSARKLGRRGPSCRSGRGDPEGAGAQRGLGALEANDERLQAHRPVVVTQRDYVLAELGASEAHDGAFGVGLRPGPAQLSGEPA